MADQSAGVEIRGEVASGSFTWNASNFAGFYYDIDDDLGTEKLTTIITEGNVLREGSGIVYTTAAQKNDFDFAGWGFYNVIGFQANKYFAGYVNDEDTDDADEILYEKSGNANTLLHRQLQPIVMDNDDEMTVTSGTPIYMEDGYLLDIKSIDIDGNKIYIELSQDGVIVDSKIVSPSKDGADMADRTYYYEKDVGECRDLVILAVHFKNAFRGADANLATIEGIWQISEEPVTVQVGTQYDRMTVTAVSSNTINMDNMDSTVILGRNMDTSLMGDIRIKTADQEIVDEVHPLRYCIYKRMSDPGYYEIRSSIASSDYEWTPQNFAGFYYDLDRDLGNEMIATAIVDGRLEGRDAIRYTTSAQSAPFAYPGWGNYSALGFLGKKHLSSYIRDGPEASSPDILAGASSFDLFHAGLLSEVLIDRGEESVLNLNYSIPLAEGYSLRISAGGDGSSALVELLRDGSIVDRKAVLLPGAYAYAKDLGELTSFPLIAARFDEPINTGNGSFIKLEGLWQISENPVRISVGSMFDAMTVSEIDPVNCSLKMDSVGYSFDLGRNMDIELMDGIGIITGDCDILRYYLYRDIEVLPSSATEKFGSTGYTGGSS